MDMAEKDVTTKIKKLSKRLIWEPLADKYGYGTPDRCFLDLDSLRVGFCEFKFIPCLPLRSKKVGLKPRQARWLSDWRAGGGLAFLVIGVTDKVAIFPDDFYRIAEKGINRNEFELIDFKDFEAKMKELIKIYVSKKTS